ncbi:hypothetical protein CN505_30015 [Bacillus cereus]|nr:hypothetical protein CN509_31440 [Bacillus cereus]PES95223.1 hypothetical protein CN505_30015 [Bacillus cereus]
MKRKILALIVPVMLLSAAGCVNNQKEKEEIKVSIEQNKPEDYPKNLEYLMKDFTDQARDIDNLINSKKSQYKKATEFRELSEPFLDTVDKVKKLEYDQKYFPVRNKVDEAMTYVKAGVDHMQTALSMGDKVSVEIAVDELKTASKLIDEGHKEMKKIK